MTANDWKWLNKNVAEHLAAKSSTGVENSPLEGLKVKYVDEEIAWLTDDEDISLGERESRKSDAEIDNSLPNRSPHEIDAESDYESMPDLEDVSESSDDEYIDNSDCDSMADLESVFSSESDLEFDEYTSWISDVDEIFSDIDKDDIPDLESISDLSKASEDDGDSLDSFQINGYFSDIEDCFKAIPDVRID
ncbi:uncharacterized protein BT62DRAFT_1013874 [Guyanagaster necrorhizus]|uniref:Uncharacterized protein n=1 Tax=Guyanagaster necrorhizus TaxID=856835 RepID=A0A9P7VFL5_9AGAR|nr:uncharacterized protein BT62DRAFT_1013874 [Guyanagaster necrorhizus MCA 3950]KAG7439500.1 hypothetical protein BT62DRAFT_1013874 [Guyanagaster necrorhizus MCA 3950]